MQTLEGMETELNVLKAEVIRMRATVGMVSQSMVGSADAMRAVSSSNDQILKLISLFDTRLDILTERIDLIDKRVEVLKGLEERVKELERERDDPRAAEGSEAHSRRG